MFRSPLLLLAFMVGTASATTISVTGGGTLTFTAYYNEVNCGTANDNPHYMADYYEYTAFSYSLGTVTNSSAAATYNASITACGIPAGASPATLVINLQNGCSINFSVTPPVSAAVSSQSCYAYSGYVDPKYIVVGVTYAPPGQSTSTWVQYQNSTFVGTTASLSNSFQSGTTTSVSASIGGSILGAGDGTISTTTSSSASSTTKSSESITTSIQVQDGEHTFGTGDYFAPVNHDYDKIWVWLNPAILFSVVPNNMTWNGYGYDTTDQSGLDIVGIELGYINGDFGAMPPDIQSSLNRAWAAGQSWAAGQGAALTAAELAQIASADPFSVSTYGTNFIGYIPPSPETSDHRFTMSTCDALSSTGAPISADSSFAYTQAAPSQSPDISTCTLTYTTTSTDALSISSSNSVVFSVDVAFKNSTFISDLSASLKESNKLTWTTLEQNSITNTTTSSAAFSLQGPPCNNVVLEQGPCVPVYDSSGTQPTQFDVYQDNLYGTFMFAPIHFY